MSITPNEWLEFAKTLVEDSEAANRSAVSRAYYAGFHFCKDFAGDINASFSDGPGCHSALIHALLEWKDQSPALPERQKNVRKLGLWLKRVRTLRTDADYKTTLNHEARHAQNAVDEVTGLMALGVRTRKLFNEQ